MTNQLTKNLELERVILALIQPGQQTGLLKFPKSRFVSIKRSN